MKKSDIMPDLNAAFEQTFGINIMNNNYESKHFFSDTIGIRAYELINFTYKTEKKFNIIFSEEEIVSEEFYTLEGLSKLIAQRLY